MLPDVRFLGLDLYYWCLILAVISALVVARIYSDRLKLPVKLQNLIFIVGFFAIILGYGSAVLFQAVYDFIATGTFSLGTGTGSTFYGGLIGGAAVFLIGYFPIGGKILGDLPKKYFPTVSSMAACAIAIAHCIGRIGCFFAGCCYGRPTDAWYGLYFPAVGDKVIPTQLFEAVYLLLLFIVLSVLVFKTKVSGLGVYLTAYAVFRFLVEYLRDDDRGALIGSISPSQFWSIVLFAVGIAVLVIFALLKKKKAEE